MHLPRLNLYELHYNLGHILHQQGDLVGAVESYRQAVALQPNYAVAHLNLGVVLDEQGQLTDAIYHYQQAIRLQPNYIKAYNNLGCALVKLARWQEAIQVYQQATDLNPDWAVLQDNLAQVLHYQGDVAGAIEAYHRALALNPAAASTHHHLGKLLQFQGQHPAAIDCFQKTIELDPAFTAAYTDCGFSWMAQGEIDRALPYFRQAMQPQLHLVQAYWQWAAQLETESTESPDELSQARIACGQFLQLLQQQATPLDLHRGLAKTYLHLANALMKYGDATQYPQAQSYYQWVLLLQPGCLEAYLQLGLCLEQQGRSNAAVLLYHLALTIHPNHSALHRQLGETLEQQQNFAAAIQHYQQALQRGLSSHTSRASLSKAAPNAGSPPSVLSFCTTLDWITANPDRATYHPLSPAPLSSPASPASPAPPVSPPASCDGLNCRPCLEKIFRWLDVTHLGKGIHTCMSSEAMPIDPLPRFVATIPQGRAWAIPQQNHWLICNAIGIIAPDQVLLSDVSRDYPGQLPGCQHPDPSRHRIFALTPLQAPQQIEGTVAALAGLSGHNYYHWMVDVLPRLALLQQAGWQGAKIDRFWVNYNGSSFQQETLKALGIPLEKVISCDQQPHLEATQLLVPSFAGHLGWLEPWALDFLRENFLPLAEPATGKPYPDRIYISRNRANHRRVLNEDALVAYLESIGFVTVELEEMPLVEQVALFAQAQVIVAPHGGGLTNLVFCQPETTVIELFTPHYIRHYYWVISQMLGLSHYFLTGEAFTCYPLRQLMYPSPLTEDIWVTIENLTDLFKRLNLQSV